MHSPLSPCQDRKIAEQAAQWLDVLARGGPRERAAFAAWLTESRRHVEEFLFMSAVDQVLDGADPQRRIDVDRLLEAGEGNVVALRTESGGACLPAGARNDPRAGLPGQPRNRPWNKRWMGGLAAALALLAAGGWALATFRWEVYTTAAGEQRTLELEDGSEVLMNTRSRLQVRFTERGRDLRLLQGEALFTVEQDLRRPFRVDTGGAVIQAIGTRFNVYRRPEGTTVSVLEGAVKITPHGSAPGIGPGQNTFKAGEQASLVREGLVRREGAVEAARVHAWRERRLIFRADTLADIAAEFNRYNRTPKIRIEDATVGARRFTGMFDANDPESLAAFLREYGDLTVDEEGEALVVRIRTAREGVPGSTPP